nr:hypothetical protein [Tanacetum cinerariifolium]
MSTQQDIYAAGSKNRPPMLYKENYVPWSSRLLHYAKSRPNGKLIYKSIIKGPYVRRMILEPGDANRGVPANETFHKQTDDELTEKELKQVEADDQAIQTILLDLPEDIYAIVNSSETTQEIWLRVQQTMKGSNIGIQEKKAKLFSEWERFTSTDRESIESYYHRFSKLMNDFKRNKHFSEKIARGRRSKSKMTRKTQDPLALMANSNNPFNYPMFHPYLPSLSTYMQQPQPNNNYNPQPSFNQNYMQQPMPNPEDITDPTTAINMAFILMAKAFKLNYTTPTNNNQKNSSNPRNRQIAQPDKVLQLLGHLARNCTVMPKRMDAAYLQTQLLIAQKEEAGIQLQAEEFNLMAATTDLDEIEELNSNCILMANLQQASTSCTQTDKASVYESDGSAEGLSKIDETHALSKPVTLNSVPTSQKSKVMKNDNVTALGIFRINPFKPSREEKSMPNKVRASVRTNPITISQPHVIIKKGVNSNLNVEAARTMLIFSHAPLFLWAEAITTACYTQNRSTIHRRFNKTSYEPINGRKPDISFLHVFVALCYPKNNREDIGKLGAKGDIGFFIGYSANSCAYRVYNRRTKKIVETLNVTFDELSAMAFEQHSELDLLFKDMYDDHICGQPLATPITVPAAQAPQVLQTPTATTTTSDTASTPTNSSSQTTSIPSISQNVDELETQQQHVQHQPATIADNVSNAMFDENTFVNLFATPSTSAAESSSSQYNGSYQDILAYVAHKSFTVFQMDVKTAFLHGTLKEDVYMCRSEGFIDADLPSHVYKLKKALYGLKQEPRAWYTHLFYDLMKSRFKMSMMGEMTFFLGLQVNQSPCGIFINQSNYVLEILKKYGMESCDPVGTLMEIKDKLDLDQNRSLVDATKYRSFCYLWGTVNTDLWYMKDSGFELTRFSDADYAGCKDTFKSTSG